MALTSSYGIRSFFLGLLILCTASSHAAAQGTSITIENGRVTLKSNDAPLNSILQEIGNQAGIKIKTFTSIEEGITANINGIPVEDSLTRLLQNYNYAFEYSRPGDTIRQVTGLCILSRKKGNNDGPVVLLGTNERTSQGAASAHANNRMPQHLFPDYMRRPPEENDPMQSFAAIDPLLIPGGPGKGMPTPSTPPSQFFPVK